MAVDLDPCLWQTSGIVKRIDGFFKWFGLTCTVLGILSIALFFLLILTTNRLTIFAPAGFVLFFVGLPCTLCGYLQYDASRPLYRVFNISKYIGFICVVSAVLIFCFQTNEIAQSYFGSTLVLFGFGALVFAFAFAACGKLISKRG